MAIYAVKKRAGMEAQLMILDFGIPLYHWLAFQDALISRMYLDVLVSPFTLAMEPDNNHIEEGGRISVTCIATQVTQFRATNLIKNFNNVTANFLIFVYLVGQ